MNSLAGKLVTADKISQLRAAARVGLRIPQTLVTADASAVRTFAARHGPICTKPFSSGVWRSPNHEELLIKDVSKLSSQRLTCRGSNRRSHSETAFLNLATNRRRVGGVGWLRRASFLKP